MENKVKIYIVDDERSIAMTLEKIIGKVFPSLELSVYNDGASAWKALQQNPEVCIVISDLNMPGLSGMQLLAKIRSTDVLKKSYFIAISSSIEPEINIKTIQQGADNFLTKPFSVDQLIVKVRSAVKVVSLIHNEEALKSQIAELNQELQNDADNMIEYIKLFQQIRMPEYTKHLPRIVEASEWIARQLCDNLGDIDDIRRAAEICFCGKLGLDARAVERPVMLKGVPTSQLMLEIPNFSRQLLSKVRNSEFIEQILYHIYENMDGSGFPEKKQAWEIPLGSRIIRVAIEFEEILKKNSDNAARTIEAMLVEAKRLYDHRVIAFYDQFLGSKEVSKEIGVKGKEETVKLHELSENMTISRNIITESGLTLMVPFSTLNEERIDRIRTIHKSDPILGKIYIRTR